MFLITVTERCYLSSASSSLGSSSTCKTSFPRGFDRSCLLTRMRIRGYVSPRSINRGNSHVAFLRTWLSFSLSVFLSFSPFLFTRGSTNRADFAFSMGTEKYRRGRSTFGTAFRKSGALALPCAFASPRSFDLARFTSRNTSKRSRGEREPLRFASVTATHVRAAPNAD